MSQVRRVLGHVVVEVTDGVRKCHRSRGRHKIPAGVPCLAIYEGSPRKRKNYCTSCAGPILEQAQEDLHAAVSGLSTHDHLQSTGGVG